MRPNELIFSVRIITGNPGGRGSYLFIFSRESRADRKELGSLSALGAFQWVPNQNFDVLNVVPISFSVSLSRRTFLVRLGVPE